MCGGDKGSGSSTATGKGSGKAVGAVQAAFGGTEKGYDKIIDAMQETPEFKAEFIGVFDKLSPMQQKLLSVDVLLPVARSKVLSEPEVYTAKRKGILEGYRGKAAGKGIPWRENAAQLNDRGLDVWEKERQECLDPTVEEPAYWELGGKGTLHSYDAGNCCWEAAFDAALGAYELVHFPEVPAQECFFKLHRELDSATIDALEGAKPSLALDLGCGTGTSTFSLRETLNSRGFQSCCLTGYDLSSHFLAVARHRARAGDKSSLPGEINFVHENALRLRAHRDGEVDIVMASALTHELPKQASEQLIREASRVLRQGGVFGYFDLNSTQLLRDNPISNIVDRVAISNEPFLHEFLALDLEGTLQKSGFEVLSVRATNVAKWEQWQDCPCRIVIARKVKTVHTSPPISLQVRRSQPGLLSCFPCLG
jgi:ubiquinone/menaquinone biosynthesis C-methylase UbiE